MSEKKKNFLQQRQKLHASIKSFNYLIENFNVQTGAQLENMLREKIKKKFVRGLLLFWSITLVPNVSYSINELETNLKYTYCITKF